MAETQNTSLQTFDFQSSKLRTLTIDNEPWFVAADVCAALGLPEPHVALRRLDDDEKGRFSIPTPGGEQEVVIINEPGLYALTLGSRKPEAKQFKRWVTHEVLPAIRQTGGYQRERQPEIQDLRFYPFDHHGRHWVARLQVRLHLALQPLVALLGLDWARWEPYFERNHARFGVVGLSGHFPGAGSSVPLAVPLAHMPEVLAELGREVPPDRQGLLQTYLAELVDTLTINWQTRHPLTRESLLADEPLSASQQEDLKTAVRARLVNSEHKQAGILYLYGRLKRRFSVEKWTDIRRGDFDAAMELIATDDGRELLRATPKLALPPAPGMALPPVKQP